MTKVKCKKPHRLTIKAKLRLHYYHFLLKTSNLIEKFKNKHNIQKSPTEKKSEQQRSKRKRVIKVKEIPQEIKPIKVNSFSHLPKKDYAELYIGQSSLHSLDKLRRHRSSRTRTRKSSSSPQDDKDEEAKGEGQHQNKEKVENDQVIIQIHPGSGDDFDEEEIKTQSEDDSKRYTLKIRHTQEPMINETKTKETYSQWEQEEEEHSANSTSDEEKEDPQVDKIKEKIRSHKLKQIAKNRTRVEKCKNIRGRKRRAKRFLKEGFIALKDNVVALTHRRRESYYQKPERNIHLGFKFNGFREAEEYEDPYSDPLQNEDLITGRKIKPKNDDSRTLLSKLFQALHRSGSDKRKNGSRIEVETFIPPRHLPQQEEGNYNTRINNPLLIRDLDDGIFCGDERDNEFIYKPQSSLTTKYAVLLRKYN